MRKILLVLFLILISTSLVVAEGQKEAAAGEEDGAVTISLSTWLTMEGASKDTIEEMVQRFEADNPDTKIELIGIPYEQVPQQVQIAVSGGNAPDVIALDPRISLPFMAQGALVDLNPYYTQDELNDIPKNTYEDGLYQGKLYTVPWQIGTIVSLFWKQLLEDAGLPVQNPETWADLKDLVQKVSDLDASIYGFGARTSKTQNSAMWFLPVMWGHEGQFQDDEGNIVFNNPGTVAALDWYKEIGTTKQTPVGMGVREVRNIFAQGKIGLVFDGPWMKGIMRNISGRSEAIDEDYFVAPMPKAADGNRYGIANGHVLAVSTQSKYPDRGVKLIKYFTQREDITKFYYEKMGAIPTYKELLSDPLYQNDPFAKAFIESAEFCRGVASKHPQYSPALDFVAIAMQAALLGEDTEEAAAMAERNIKTLYGQ